MKNKVILNINEDKSEEKLFLNENYELSLGRLYLVLSPIEMVEELILLNSNIKIDIQRISIINSYTNLIKVDVIKPLNYFGESIFSRKEIINLFKHFSLINKDRKTFYYENDSMNLVKIFSLNELTKKDVLFINSVGIGYDEIIQLLNLSNQIIKKNNNKTIIFVHSNFKSTKKITIKEVSDSNLKIMTELINRF